LPFIQRIQAKLPYGNSSRRKFIKGSNENYIIIAEQEPRERLDDEVILSSQKPLGLMKELLDRFTLPGQLIYEPCCGTGKKSSRDLFNKKR
jgi:DNA modification methylase